jgi:hypothetical protein
MRGTGATVALLPNGARAPHISAAMPALRDERAGYCAQAHGQGWKRSPIAINSFR